MRFSMLPPPPPVSVVLPKLTAPRSPAALSLVLRPAAAPPVSAPSATDEVGTVPPPSHVRKPFVVGDRVRHRSADKHAYRGVGTIRAIDCDMADVSWDTSTPEKPLETVYHADIRRAVER